MGVRQKAVDTIVVSTAQNKATPYIILGGVVIGGILLTYVTIKVMEALQLKDTREEKKAGRKAGRLTNEEAFDPVHSRNNPSKVTITQQRAEQLAKNIFESSGYVTASKYGQPSWLGWMYDDKEDEARGAIRDAGTTYNLSKVADVMYKKYKVGLLDFLQDFNGEGEMSKYYDIIDNYKS